MPKCSRMARAKTVGFDVADLENGSVGGEILQNLRNRWIQRVFEDPRLPVPVSIGFDEGIDSIVVGPECTKGVFERGADA